MSKTDKSYLIIFFTDKKIEILVRGRETLYFIFNEIKCYLHKIRETNIVILLSC